MVVGAGSWGTALAIALARNELPVQLWGRDPERQRSMQLSRENKQYLPGAKFPASLTAIAEISEPASRVVVSVPSMSLRSVLQQLREKFVPEPAICLTCKGLEQDSLGLVHEVAQQALPGSESTVLSGPSFASDVAMGKPTGVAVAAASIKVAEQWAGMFHSGSFRVYVNSDINGVAISGVVKNVIAIATGIAAGLDLGPNAQAVLVTRGLAEMSRVGVALGGKLETFMGLAGIGDLVLTCTDDESRNRRLGRLIVECGGVEEARRELSATTEGANAVAPLLSLAKRVGASMPISEQVQAILNGTTTPQKAMQVLLSRSPKMEYR